MYIKLLCNYLILMKCIIQLDTYSLVVLSCLNIPLLKKKRITIPTRLGI